MTSTFLVQPTEQKKILLPKVQIKEFEKLSCFYFFNSEKKKKERENGRQAGGKKLIEEELRQLLRIHYIDYGVCQGG